MAMSWKGKFESYDGRTVVFVDEYFPVVLGKVYYKRSLCINSYELLVHHGPKCYACKSYRKNVRALLTKHQLQVNVAKMTSHANYRYLQSPERKKFMVNLKTELRKCKQEVTKLKQDLICWEEKRSKCWRGLVQRSGVNHEWENRKNLKQLPTQLIHRLFWEQQLEAMKMKVKNARQVWWDPIMIKWCLSLKLLSPFACHALRSSNPSVVIWENYTHFIEAKGGFQAEVDLQLWDWYHSRLPEVVHLCVWWGQDQGRPGVWQTLWRGGWVCECGWRQ